LIISILTIIIVGVAATIIILYKYKPNELKTFGKKARDFGIKTTKTIREQTVKGIEKMREEASVISEKVKEKIKKED
ncbi:MAG: hypothetical protein ACFFHV_15850, partial [Promethearchaeota archaeon]